MPKQSYFQHLDWLRGYAMLLGVPFHVGLIYAVGNEWFVTSPDKSLPLTWLTGVLTSFRMPLFFIISGLLSAMVLARREPGVWLEKRFVRLAIPYVAATIVISPMVIWLMAMMATDVSGAQSTSSYFWDLITTVDTHWVGHLWFLKVLLIFSIITYFGRPVLAWVNRFIDNHMVTETGQLKLSSIWMVTAGAVIYKIGVEGTAFVLEEIIPGIYVPLNKLLALEASAQFAPYYFIGFLLFNRTLPRLHVQWLPLGVIAVCAAVFAVVWNVPANVTDKLLTYISGTILAILVSMVAMTWAEEHITNVTGFGRKVVDGSFTIYLFHYPICIYIGYYFADIQWPVIVEYLINTIVTIGLSLMIHIFIIDRFQITRLLFNGASPKPKTAPVSDSPAQAK